MFFISARLVRTESVPCDINNPLRKPPRYSDLHISQTLPKTNKINKVNPYSSVQLNKKIYCILSVQLQQTIYTYFMCLINNHGEIHPLFLDRMSGLQQSLYRFNCLLPAYSNLVLVQLGDCNEGAECRKLCSSNHIYLCCQYQQPRHMDIRTGEFTGLAWMIMHLYR